MTVETLGVDIGGVIIGRVNEGTDTSFFADRYLETPAVPGAVAALARLSAERFAGRIFLVSKCGKKTEARTREWLLHHDFYAAVGMPADNIRFCRERREKAAIAAALGITHFVDDRLEVLGTLAGVPHRYLFDGVASEIDAHRQYLPLVSRVVGWAEIVADLLPS